MRRRGNLVRIARATHFAFEDSAMLDDERGVMDIARDMRIAAKNDLFAANIAVDPPVDMGMVGKNITVDVAGMAHHQDRAVQIALDLTKHIQLARA